MSLGILGPGGGYVAFCRGERRDVVDVDFLADEEDALDCVGGQGGACCWVDGLHSE